MRAWLNLLASFACVAACAGVVHARQPPKLTASDLDRIGRAFASEKCTKPSKFSVRKLPNRYDPEVIDEIHAVSCAGFHVEVYRAGAVGMPRELPVSALVDRPLPSIPAAISIGASIASVRAALGPPSLVSDGSPVYFLGAERPGQDTVMFRIVGGKVRELLWSWEVD